ncbi:CaM binding domain-containing protein [Abeliophyllum distichum]|uniref:CaM binding domain-containing protein n=1 Tax=Abeliophyllum distichum TaxID=126358 RepID=A0ABD1PBB2_9LAMI
MVQRKVLNQLGIQFQADGDKSEKLLQQQDGKNRGPDLKKKMKKSGSMKRQDFERLRLPNMGRQERQPAKPPPSLAVSTTVATPQKQPTIKGGASVDMSTLTPNYMKSTSSSEARKDRSQVSSSRSPKTSPESINSRRKSSSSSRMLCRTSNLKTMRILTKTPSFKPARSSAKKSTSVVFCENLDVQRSTCSSTLKDYKFPSYLSLSPGGTESEGTSVMKVCPYTYCSLNGHRHAHVPPLKKFMSARRLLIKTQRGLKLGCLSPRRSRPAGDGVNFDREVPSRDELDSSTISPLIQEEHGDFYVEIYGVKKEDSVDHTGIDQIKSHLSMMTDFVPSVESSDEKEEGSGDDQLCTDNDSSGSSDQNADAAFFHEEIGVAEEIKIPSMAEEETKLGCLRVQTEITRENVQSVQSEELDSDASDMDWEAGGYSAFYLDDDHDYSLKGTKECDCKGDYSSEVDGCIIQEESIFNPDENISSCFDEIPADEERWSSESTGSYEYLDNLNIEITSFRFEDQMGNLEESKEGKNDIVSSDLDSDEEDGPAVLGCQGSDVPDDVSTGNLNEKYEDDVGSLDTKEEYQSDTANIYLLSEETFDGGVLPICEDPETDQNCIMQAELSTTDNGNGIDVKDPSDAAKLTGINASDEDPQTRNAEYQGQLVNHCNEAENFWKLIPVDPEKGTCLGIPDLNIAENGDHAVQRVLVNATKAETKDTCLTRATLKESDNAFDTNLKATARRKRSIDECDESRQFNPRAPNYLPVEPDPDAEKVDLKHQMMDDRKNAEEWMLDYALRQTVTKLAPARKRKVALLVEAFEKVLPSEPHPAHSSAALGHARPIQACR